MSYEPDRDKKAERAIYETHDPKWVQGTRQDICRCRCGLCVSFGKHYGRHVR